MPIIAAVSRCNIPVTHKSESESYLLSMKMVIIALKISQTVIHVYNLDMVCLIENTILLSSDWLPLDKNEEGNLGPQDSCHLNSSHGHNFMKESGRGGDNLQI